LSDINGARHPSRRRGVGAGAQLAAVRREELGLITETLGRLL
jgi:hypothetical protein